MKLLEDNVTTGKRLEKLKDVTASARGGLGKKVDTEC